MDSESSRALIAVGYWHEPRSKDVLPHPQELVDPSWCAEERCCIIKYLRCGVRIREALGYSWCRFPDGPPDWDMGCCDLTDGIWMWPEGLHVYVDRYSVRLPDEFVAHMKQNDFEIPQDLDQTELEERPVDGAFWIEWSKANCRPPHPPQPSPPRSLLSGFLQRFLGRRIEKGVRMIFVDAGR